MLAVLSQCGSRVYRAISKMNGSHAEVVTTRVSWRSRLARWLLAFTVLCLVYQAYAIAIVPLVEPTIRTGTSAIGHAHIESQTASHLELEQLFPPDAWERNDPMMLETDGGMLLFQDYETSRDGRLILSPCTVVFFAPLGQSRTEGTSAVGPNAASCQGRPIILKAPDRAVLNFSGPLDLGRAKISRLQGARLEGEITIQSAPSQPNANDELLIVTRNVQISPDQIWTPHDIQFSYGPHRGSGRDLSISLATADENSNASSDASLISAVKSLELVHLDRLSFDLPDPQVLRDPKAGADAAELQADPSTSKTAVNTPVEITCHGPFRFDFQAGVASFEDHVDVMRVAESNMEDRLNCQQLLIHFNVDDQSERSSPSADQRDGEEPPAPMSLAPQRIIALGLPVVLQAPSWQTAAHGKRLEYDFTTRRILLADDQDAEFKHRQHRVISSKLEYEVHPQTSQLGKLWAAGPGTYQGHSGTANGQSIMAAWEGELRLQPQDGLHVLSVMEGAKITLSQASEEAVSDASRASDRIGQFSADTLFLWLATSSAMSEPRTNEARSSAATIQLAANHSESLYTARRQLPADSELPELAAPQQNAHSQPADDAEHKPARARIQPVKMLADGKVHVDSSQLTGSARRLEIWFDNPAPPQADRQPRSARQPRNPIVQQQSAQQQSAQQQSAQQQSAQQSRAEDQPVTLSSDRNRPLKFDGGLVRLRILMSEPRPTVREATITENVRLIQNESPHGAQSLMVTGQTLRLRNDSLERTTIDILGAPARVFAQQLLLEGAALHLSQRENRLWADGPGRMKLPSRQTQSTSLKAGTPMWVNWKGGMDFNGQVARFLREVEIRGVHTLADGKNMHLVARGDQLHAKMNRYVAFQKSRVDRDLDVAEIRFLGEVSVENQTFAPSGTITSQDQLRMHDFVVDRGSGDFRGEGPGWIIRRQIDDGAVPSSFNNSQPAPSVTSSGMSGSQQLSFLRVDFETAAIGNIDQREVEFGDFVQAVYGPIGTWNDKLDPNAAVGVGPQGILLTCQRMILAQMGQSGMQSIELKAIGDTFVEGEQFAARGDRLSYSAMKDQLILEGVGRSFAVLEQRGRAGQRPSTSSARKIIFFPRSGQLEVEDARSIDYTHYGSPTARSPVRQPSPPPPRVR